MKESQKSNGQRSKLSRPFAVELIARLAARVGSALRVLSSRSEHQTSKEENAASFAKSGDLNSVHPLLPKGGGGRGEEANKNIDQPVAHDFEADAPHPKSVPDWVGRGSGAGAVGEHRTSNIQRPPSNEQRAVRPRTAPTMAGPASLALGEQDVRAIRQHPPADSILHSAFPVPSSGFTADFVSRQELKRELDSLRKLIESRK
jgi:hypothetical protein